MEYLRFSLWFTVIHMFSYTLAGMLALKISADMYRGQNRLLDYLRDMAREDENRRVAKFSLLAQVPRGLLMSFVFYPVLSVLQGLSFGLLFVFFAGLMLIFTDLACAVPFPHNIEGFVYLKSRYLQWSLVWKLYFEILLYSVFFGLLAAWILF